MPEIVARLAFLGLHANRLVAMESVNPGKAPAVFNRSELKMRDSEILSPLIR